MLDTIKIGVSAIFVFVVSREEKGKKNYNWNFWIWVILVQTWPFHDANVSKNC